MRAIIGPFIALFTLAAATAAHAQTLYDHNGSLMRVVEQGNTVRIFYEQPRPGMSAVGVRSGTLLFEGTLDANRYLEGFSRIFSARCGELDYFVYGQYVRNGNFVLSGAAPVLAQGGCRVVDNTTEGSNANLAFTLRSANVTPQPQPQPQPPPPAAATGFGPFCVTGVNSSLNMRAGPGTGYGVVGSLPGGQCNVAGYNRCESGWCFVASGNQLGWVSRQFLR